MINAIFKQQLQVMTTNTLHNYQYCPFQKTTYSFAINTFRTGK